MRNRVGIYCRLSDEDRYKKNSDDDSDSIVNQKSMLLKYALSHEWEVVNIYSDDDWSGADSKRPEFNKLIKDCEDNKIDIVLCKTQSRFSRDMEIVEKYIHNKFLEWGIRFVSIVDNADTEVHGNKKARQINGLINEWYLEDLSDNIRTSLKNKREDGLFVGAAAPYGYKKDPSNKNKLIVDPVSALVVKNIFKMYIEGKGYAYISQELNRKKIKTPAQYKKDNGYYHNNKDLSKYDNKGWYMTLVKRIITNEVYIGNLVQGKTSYISYKNHKEYTKPKEEWIRSENTHEAIIDIDTWTIAQSKIKSNARIGITTGERYILSGKVHCAICGRNFIKNSFRLKSGKAPYLRCNGLRQYNKVCDNVGSIRADILERLVLDEINKQLDKYYSVGELEKNDLLYQNGILKTFNSENNILSSEKKELLEKIEHKQYQYKQMYEDKLDGIITTEDFLLFKNKFDEEVQRANNRINEINEEINEETNKLKNIDDKVTFSKKILNKYKHINTLTREIVDEFVESIIIGRKKDDNTREIEIHLKIIDID